LAIDRAPKFRLPDKILRTWIDDLNLARFESHIFAVDCIVALRCARLNTFDPRSERDALIAATAIVQGTTVVTRIVNYFAETGANIYTIYGMPLDNTVQCCFSIQSGTPP